MPIFEVNKKKSEGVGTATFSKKEDYKVVTLNSDPTKKERVLHVIQADRLIKNKKAEEVKGAKLSEREIVNVVTPIKQD